MTKNIAIIGQTPDPHIEKVSNLVSAMGANPILFDRYHVGHALELAASNRGIRGYFQIDGEKHSFADIHAVWWRWKPVVVAEYTGNFAHQSDAFASGEWRHVLYSLSEYLSHALWINPFHKHYLMHRKALQLVLATKVGLDIPDTVFTNDPASVEQLFERHDRVIYKPIKTFLVGTENVIYTNEVFRDDIRQSPEAIRLAPGIFQELVEKDYEMRITVVGEECFPVRINSQDRESTRIDWRHSQLEDMYTIESIGDDLRDRLLQFHQQAGLIYGAYDFIVRKSGEPVFLECNPGGQWLWLENALDLQISQAVAQRLVDSE